MNRTALGLAIALGLATTVSAQPPKTPAVPPINPAQARLDQTLGGLDGPCYALASGDNADVLIAAGERGTLLAWPRSAWMGVRIGEKAPDVSLAHEGSITALAWGNKDWLASAGADRKIRLWAMPGREAKFTLETGELVRALAFSPDGKRLAAGDDSNAIHLFDTGTGKPVGKLSGHSDWPVSLTFSPDGMRLVSGGLDGQLLLWDVAAAKKVMDLQARTPPPANTPPPPLAAVTAVAFRSDGKMLAAGNSAGQIHLIDPATGKIVKPTAVSHTSAVTGLAFHPGGAVLASSSKDRTVKLWDANGGGQLISLDGHTAWVQGVVFLEKGTRLATVGADQTVRVWDLTPKK
jgi:WD40 repeat protein